MTCARSVYCVLDSVSYMSFAICSAKVKSLLAAVEGKDINEVIAEGMKKIGSVSLGGGGGGGGAAAPAAGAAAAAPAAAAAAPVEEEEDDDMGFGLFD